MERVMLPLSKRKRYSQQPSSSTDIERTIGPDDVHIQSYLQSGFSDSVAAFETIVREVSATSGFPLAIPGCFLHQVYALIDDKTVANLELQEARASRILRHLHVERCGTLLVRESEYRALLLRLIETAAKDPNAKTENKLLRKFYERVVLTYNELGITQKHLLDMMDMPEENERTVVITLLRMGFIVFQTPSVEIDCEPAFWLSLPNIGTLSKEVHGARKEILQMIKSARPYREILRSKLRSKGKLRSSSMSIDFHIKDVIGAKVVVWRDTAIEGSRSLLLLPDKLVG